MVWMKTGCSGVGLGEGDERAAGVDDIIDITECLSSMRRDVAVAAIAATSRLATLALMALFDGVFTDYDTSARPQAAPGAASLMVWDSMFFGRIVQAGYEHEQFYAFFPLYPALVRVLSACAGGIVPGSSRDAWTAVSAVAVSNAAFIISAVYFDRLSFRVLQEKRTASVATLLYCVNPASVFCSAAYTESLFLALSFAGLWHLYHKPWLATALLALASSARSNGILSAWFVLHNGLQQLVRKWPRQKAHAVGGLCMTAAQCAAVLAPLAAFQFHGYLRFCSGQPSSGVPLWCAERVPYIYGYVQSHYWGVGFLKYWQISQIPNFMLAAPALALSCCGCFAYFSVAWMRALSLGIVTEAGGSQHLIHSASAASVQKPPSSERRPQGEAAGFYGNSVGVYIHHWAFMAAFALCCMHVQVATRFLLGAPPLFWFAAHMAQRGHKTLVWAWCLGYAALGCLLYTNFYPWT